jgi:type II secretory pathway predicted ATPase ExeA
VYKNFFGLDKDPFNVNPDPSFLFSTPETEGTYTSLLNGIRTRKGLIVLTGEVGTGKTLLLRKLMDEVRAEWAASAFVFNPRMSADDFLDYVLSDFGVDHNGKGGWLVSRKLQDWLLKRHALGFVSVLIVDEAQNLSPEVFEVVRALSSIETPTEKLLQIILSGQRELDGMLRRPRLQAFSQRVALRLRTRPLNTEETGQYITHRLRVAGGEVEKVFTPGAVRAVAAAAGGIPRVINLVCEHALIAGYADQRKPVGAQTVMNVAREFSLGGGHLAREVLAEEGQEAELTYQTEAQSGSPVKEAPVEEKPEPVESKASKAGEELAQTRATGGALPEAPPSFPALGRTISPTPVQEEVAGTAERGDTPIYDFPTEFGRAKPDWGLWVPGVLVVLLAILGVYYFAGGRLPGRARQSEPSYTSSSTPSSQPATADSSNPPNAEPGGRPEQAQTPAPPVQRESADAAGGAAAPPATAADQAILSETPKRTPQLRPVPSRAQEAGQASGAGAPAPAQRPSLGQLAVTSNVPRASVTVDGQSRPDWMTPFTFKMLAPGTHSVTVSKDGYRTTNQTVTVEAGENTSINATLAPSGGEIDISTNPATAEVFIDGKSYGSGPVRAQVEVGQHTYLVRQAGRETVEGKLEVKDQSVVQRSVDLPLKPPPTPAVNITVTTQPPSAKIYADGAAMSGASPLSFHLAAGHHTLIIFAQGRRPVRREVDISESGLLTLYVTLPEQ